VTLYLSTNSLDRVSSAELSALNNQKLCELVERVNRCALTSTVEERIQALREQHEIDINQLESSCTPIDMSRSLQAAAKESSARVSRLEEALSNKLERSEIRHIESLVTDLETYALFKESASLRIASLEASSDKLLRRMEGYSKDLGGIFDQVEGLAGDWQANHKAVEGKLKSIQGEAADLKHFTMTNCVRESSFLEVFLNVK
jgi:chromosome segregation ATPase